MSYSYQTERPWLFTEEGSVAFLRVRDHVQTLLKKAGAFRMAEAWDCNHGATNSWKMLALVDRLVELREICEITGPDVAGQHRVFVETPR